MSEPYTCVKGCHYTTDNQKSLKLHLNQCPALLQRIQENEEYLERKRNAASDPDAPLDHFRPSKLARNDDLPVDLVAHSSLSTHDTRLLDQDVLADPDNLSSTEPGPSLQRPHTPSETAPSFPAYLPSLGRLRDETNTLPEAPPPPDPPDAVDTPAPRVHRIILRVRPEPVPYTTPPDSFGQYRVYPSKPRTIPDSACELEDLSDIQTPSNPQRPIPSQSTADLIAPCPNISAFRLQYWHWNEGLKKSESACESLIHDVISQPDFVPSDISQVKWDKLDDALASHAAESSSSKPNTLLPLSLPPRTPAAAAHYKSEPSLNVVPILAVQCLSLTHAVQLSFTQNNLRHQGGPGE
ncbi:hypothetical protein FRC06_001571 [Ceratobasidium sp. 370]|nr:hypothetical protein FRC06_001571 [Ceratobasidium sp. 370]